MLIYYIAIGLIIYLTARFLNHTRFNENPIKKYKAALISILIFSVLFIIYFILRLYLHEQIQISSGVKFEQKKFFSIFQSLFGGILFYITIKKVDIHSKPPTDIEKIEPKL